MFCFTVDFIFLTRGGFDICLLDDKGYAEFNLSQRKFDFKLLQIKQARSFTNTEATSSSTTSVKAQPHAFLKNICSNIAAVHVAQWFNSSTACIVNTAYVYNPF